MKNNNKNVKNKTGNRESSNKKKWRVIIISSFLVLVAGFIIYRMLTVETPPDEFLVRGAAYITANSPFMLDAVTRSDGAVALPNNTLQYNMTFINMQKGVTPDIEGFAKFARKGVINNVRHSVVMQPLRERKVKFIYHYNDKNGVFLFQVKVMPSDYQ
jgi:hypothetical protein